MLKNGIIEIFSSFIPILVLTKYGRINSQLTWMSLIAISSIFGLFFEYYYPAAAFITVVKWAGKFGAAAMFSQIYVHTPEFFPTNLRGKGLGIPDGISRFTAMITPFFGMLYREQTFWYWIMQGRKQWPKYGYWHCQPLALV